MDIVENQDGLEFDVDALITDVNGKAETDFINVNNSGTSRGAGWALPSNTTIVDLNLGPTDTNYTAPANGYFVFGMVAGAANDFVNMGTWRQPYDDGKFYSQVNNAVAAGNWLTSIIPVLKGTIVNVDYQNTAPSGRLLYFRFIYAKGSEWEAQ